MHKRMPFKKWLLLVIATVLLPAGGAIAVVNYKSALQFGTASTWTSATGGGGHGIYWKTSTNLPTVRQDDGTEISWSAGGGGSGGVVTAPFTVADTASPLGAPLLKVTDNAGANTYFSVSAAAANSAVASFLDGSSAAVSSAGQGNLIYDNTSHTFKISTNGGAYATISTGSTSWPLQNGTSTNTFLYGGTMTGSSIAESHDSTNAFTTGDIAFEHKTAGTRDWFFGYPAAATIPELRGASDNIGMRNSSGTGVVMQDPNTTRIYGANNDNWDFVANNYLAPSGDNVYDIGTASLRVRNIYSVNTFANSVNPATAAQAMALCSNATNCTSLGIATTGVRSTVNGPLQVVAQSAPGSPQPGDVWVDATQLAVKTRVDGLNQTLEGVIFTGTASATVSTATTATVVGTGVGTLTFPANTCVVGKSIRAHVGGVMTTSATPGNYTFFFKLGSTTIATTGTFTPQVSATTKGWAMDALITFRSCGVSGTVLVDGAATYPSAAGARGVQDLNNNGSTTTINTTGSLAFDAQVTLGSASQTVVGTASSWEVLN